MMKATVTLLVCSTLVVLTCADVFDVPRWTEVIKTRNEQCIDRGYNGACDFETEDGDIIYSCSNLRCGKGREVIFAAFNAGPVAEGSYCGDSRACIHGECVTVDPHHLPKYTNEETKIPTCN